MNTSIAAPITTTNDNSRSIYANRFMELMLALNTNSTKIRFEVMKELLNSYHFNLLNDNQVKYVLEQFQTKSAKATRVGQAAGRAGVSPKQKQKKIYTEPSIFTGNKWRFNCHTCNRAVEVGESNIALNDRRWCVACGIEHYPDLKESKSFTKWKNNYNFGI